MKIGGIDWTVNARSFSGDGHVDLTRLKEAMEEIEKAKKASGVEEQNLSP